MRKGVSAGSSRAWLGNVAALAISLALAGLGGECVIRFARPETVLFPRYHAEARYGDFVLRTLVPSTRFTHRSTDGSWDFITNEQGFRDERDYRHAKEPGLLRVMALGDSTTQGFEVRQDHTYSAVMERALARIGFSAEVLNMGVSGFSTAEELVFLEHEGFRYRPDAVVVGIYANDFEDNVKAGLYSLDEGGRLSLKKKRHAPGVRALRVINAIPLARWLSENSFLYSLGLNTAWNTAKRMLLEEGEARLTTEFAVPTEEVDEYKARLLAALVARMHELCREREVLLILLDIPRTSPGDPLDFRSSVPEELVPKLKATSDAFLSSEEVLGRFRGTTQFHVRHGQRHINELSHLMFGLAAADLIASERSARQGQTVSQGQAGSTQAPGGAHR